jgi:hypothetical protein
MVSIAKMREQLLEGFPEPQADLMARVIAAVRDEPSTHARPNDDSAAALPDFAVLKKRLDESMRQLAKAQAQTRRALKDLAKQLAKYGLGGSLEDFACDLVPELLEKHWAMVVESAAPEDVTVGDGPREFDIVVRGRIDGRPLAVVCEAKATVSVKEVKRFLTLVGRLRDARPADDIRPLFFGYKADRRARELIVASGAAMVFTRGVMIPLPPG